MSDRETEKVSQTARARQRWLRWGAGVAWVLALLLIGLALHFPTLKQRQYLDQLEARGLHLVRFYEDSWNLLEWSYWLEEHVGLELLLRPEVVAVDARQVRLDDRTLAEFTGWPRLSQLHIPQGDITEATLEHFVRGTPALQELLVCNAPRIRPEFIQTLREDFPALRLEYRGTAYLGIRGQGLGLRLEMGLEQPQGCLVLYVEPGSAADRGGILAGDVITQLSDRKIQDFQALVEQIARQEPEDTIPVQILRNEQTLELECTLQPWPTP